MISVKDITIVIPHLGRTKEQKYSLSQCLLSLDETVPEIRKIIIKNSGTEPIEGFASKFQTIYLRQQGQCKAVNVGVSITRTPWIMVSNDDMVYPPGWFEKLTFWDTKSKNFCISPKLVEPRSGAPTFITYFCGGAGGDFDKNKFLKFVKEHKDSEVLEKSGLLHSGFNLPFLLKREVWDTVGGYDVNYDPWSSNSDSDLEYKLKLAGVDLFQDQNCLVYHFSQTSGTFEPKNRPAWERNWQYFIDKWGFPRTDDGVWEANFHMPTPEEGRIFKPGWEGKYVSKS